MPRKQESPYRLLVFGLTCAPVLLPLIEEGGGDDGALFEEVQLLLRRGYPRSSPGLRFSATAACRLHAGEISREERWRRSEADAAWPSAADLVPARPRIVWLIVSEDGPERLLKKISAG